MNCAKNILFISFLVTTYVYSSSAHSSSSHIELPFEDWLKMSNLAIDYNRAILDLQTDKKPNFDKIFEEMESLAQKLPQENKAQQQYQILIADRKKIIEKLKSSSM